jgi:hypothetical protein
MMFRLRPTGEEARLVYIRADDVSVWRGGFSHFTVPLSDFDRDWDLVTAAEQSVREAAYQARTILLRIPGELRGAALSEMGICPHCGVDELHADGTLPDVRCQCWNDE